jgi:altronate dehydratase small subunit
MKAALVISARDNVATALQPLRPGQRVDINGSIIVVGEPIARGHKIALRPIPAGEPVVKYGSAIGTASNDIAAGAHVHTHNVASSRGRGDLDVPVQGEARLAEPSDDGAGRGTDNGSAAASTSISSESTS